MPSKSHQLSTYMYNQKISKDIYKKKFYQNKKTRNNIHLKLIFFISPTIIFIFLYFDSHTSHKTVKKNFILIKK